jgi:hypothetical protein
MSSEPILPGFYPDPTICRVGADYYLATSSFEYFPGAPIWHSRDLVRWTQIGHILDRRGQFARGSGRPSTGLYAGTLRHHGGRFWYVTTNITDDVDGQLLVNAEDPAGPWSDPVHIPEAVGIDPDLAWDEADQCYLTWKAMDVTEGEIGILQSRLDLDTGRLIDTAYPVWQGSGLAAAEGPHLYQAKGYWYLLLAEGGTERGHAVTIARGPHPSGPFEPCPANPVLSHRSSIHPVQNTGHADLVETPTGEWAAVYLGARPRGSTPGFHVLGRETFVAGVTWTEGWPVIDEERFEVPAPETGFVDDFSGPQLDLRWVVPGAEASSTVERNATGDLVIRPTAGTDGPSRSMGLLCTRVRDLSWTSEATFEGSGRFLLLLDDRHWYGIVRNGAIAQAVVRVGDIEVEVAAHDVPDGPAPLRIESVPPASPMVPLGHGGPDDIVLSIVLPDGSRELARLDGRYLSTEVASGFTGRMLAIGSTTEPTTVRSMAYRPTTGTPLMSCPENPGQQRHRTFTTQEQA